MPPTVTVVVPVYNVEAHLEQCVTSLLAQSLADIEVILVNDASTDSSGGLADSLGSDPRVQVVHADVNKGLAATRNAGLDEARGTWVSFVDSDDFVQPTMLERLVDAAIDAGADIAGCAVDLCAADGTIVKALPHPLSGRGPLDHSDVATLMRAGHEGAFMWFVWRNLYRRSVLDDHGIRFDSEVRFAEDSVFNLHAFWHAKRVIVLEESLYSYRKNPSGLTSVRYKAYVNASLSRQYAGKKAFYDDAGVYGRGRYGDLHEYVLRHQLRILLSNARASPSAIARLSAVTRVLTLPMVRESVRIVTAQRAGAVLRRLRTSSRWAHLFRSVRHTESSGSSRP